jgi:hypothetical protein
MRPNKGELEAPRVSVSAECGGRAALESNRRGSDNRSNLINVNIMTAILALAQQPLPKETLGANLQMIEHEQRGAYHYH